MKSQITFILFLFLMTQIKSFAQYEIYDQMLNMQMQMYQQNLQRVYSQIETRHEYSCTDGENITCFFLMVRMNGFPGASAKIYNRDGSKSQSLKLDYYNPMSISINTTKEWELNYGDRITFTYDGNSTKTLEVGVDDNMSEIDWERYTTQLKNEAKQKIENFNSEVRQPSMSNTVVYPTGQPSINSTGSTLTLRKVTCTVCKGTGVSMSTTTVPTFGLGGQHWCDVCKMMVSDSHGSHKSCPLCQGKGYIEKYIP